MAVRGRIKQTAADTQNNDERDAEIFVTKIQKMKGKLFLSLVEVGEVLGVRYRIVQRYVKLGELPAAKIGGTWRVYADDLFKFFRQVCRYNGDGK